MKPKSTRRGVAGRGPTMDERLAWALNHPLRAQILAILNDRPASPKEMSVTLKVELSNVSYHVRELAKYELIEVVRQEHVRGAVKTVYRATTRMLLDDDAWTSLSKETRTGISINAVNEVIDRTAKAIIAGTFDARPDRSVITLKFEADENGWSEAQAIVRDAYEKLSEVEARAVDRKSHGAETFPMTVSLLAYESPDSSSAS